MSLRRFLNVAYAILVDEFQRSGSDLQSALERVNQIAAGVVPSAPEPVSATPAQNEEAMAALTSMMKGMANNPLQQKRKPRRA